MSYSRVVFEKRSNTPHKWGSPCGWLCRPYPCVSVALCIFALGCAANGQGGGPPDGNMLSTSDGSVLVVAPDASTVDAQGPRMDAGVSRDAGPMPVDAAIDASGGDIMADAGAMDTLDAAMDAEVADAGGMDAGLTDAGPPATPAPGSYLYRRIPVGGIEETIAIAFHPSGDYAVVLEYDEAVVVVDWATETASRFVLETSGSALYFHDVAFNASGSEAYLVAHERRRDVDTGVMYRFDHAAWTAAPSASAFTRLSETRTGERFMAIEYRSASDRPVVLSQSGPSPGYIARLRELEPSTGNFTGLVTARATSAGCDDFAFVNNEFGTWGIAVVCGTNGADAPYYTEIGGVGEWRSGPSASLGNTSHIAAYPGGAYGLAVSWSGRRLYRVEAGLYSSRASSPGFSSRGIYGVAFQEDGRRALLVGRTSGTTGTVMEYRHDLFSASAITDVSIPAFTSSPFLADSNTYLHDAAFHPGCDEGWIVGGRFTLGYLIHFQIEGGRPCR